MTNNIDFIKIEKYKHYDTTNYVYQLMFNGEDIPFLLHAESGYKHVDAEIQFDVDIEILDKDFNITTPIGIKYEIKGNIRDLKLKVIEDWDNITKWMNELTSALNTILGQFKKVIEGNEEGRKDET